MSQKVERPGLSTMPRIAGAETRAIERRRVSWQADVMLVERVNFYEDDDGVWFAECLVCKAWVGRGDGTRPSAAERFGRHLQNDRHDPEPPTTVESLPHPTHSAPATGKHDPAR